MASYGGGVLIHNKPADAAVQTARQGQDGGGGPDRGKVDHRPAAQLAVLRPGGAQCRDHRTARTDQQQDDAACWALAPRDFRADRARRAQAATGRTVRIRGMEGRGA